jgi:hypothetical protein
MPAIPHSHSHCRWMNIEADLCSVKTTMSRAARAELTGINRP